MESPFSHVTNIVVLDDNFTIRHTLKTFLKLLSRKVRQELRVYTSQDGVEGLGYIYATDPEIVIVDTTLPKYSGRELIEYLASNPKFSQKHRRVIVIIDDGTNKLKLPAMYIVLNKNRPRFLFDLLKEVLRLLRRDSILQKEDQQFGWLAKLGAWAIFLANVGDKLIYKAATKPRLLGVFYRLPWLAIQFLLSICLSVIKICTPHAQDDNVRQSGRDAWAFRARHYPTVVAGFVALGLFSVQLITYMLSGLALFNIGGRVETALAEFGNGYSYRRAITIDADQVSGSADLIDFPVVISGTLPYLATTDNGGNVESMSGYDIIFTEDAAGASPLDHEIEVYQPTTGELVAWVKVPTLDHDDDTTIYLFYGNSSVVTSQQDVAGTWSNGFASVYHLNGDPASLGPQFLNSANNTLEGTAGGSWTFDDQVGAKLGTGINFDASQSNRIQATDQLSGSVLTVSGWVNADVLSENYISLAMRANAGVDDLDYLMYVRNVDAPGGFNRPSAFVNRTTGGYLQAGGASVLATGTWYYLAFTYDAADIRMYQNGALANSANCASNCGINDSNRDVWIGGSEPWGEHFDGVIDEFRVASVARNTDWIATEFNSQNDPSSFYTISSEATNPPEVNVAALGEQFSTLAPEATDRYIGGGFAVTTVNSPVTITGVTISEAGSIDAATGLDNVRLFYEIDSSAPYDCSSESYSGSELQYGATTSFDSANGDAVFSASVEIEADIEALCLYVVLDVTASANSGDTIEIQISAPSADISVNEGTVTPASAVALAGTTEVEATIFSNNAKFRRTITIDEAQVAGSGDHTNFPVLISGTYPYLRTVANGGNVEHSNGYDIFFTSDTVGTTQLDHQIESYDPVTGYIVAWVRVPALDFDDDTLIYLFYGDDTISASQEDITGTWNSNYRMVQHMSEANGGNNQQLLDATTNNNDSNSVNVTAQGVAGQIGSAMNFDGSDDVVIFPNSASIGINSTMTLQAWIRSDSPGLRGILSRHNASDRNTYRLEQNTTGRMQFGWYWGGLDELFTADGVINSDSTTWYHVAGVFDDAGNMRRIYVNGVESASQSTMNTPPPDSGTYTLEIGANREDNYFDGLIDEVRISATALSGDWLLTEYNNQSSPATFYSVGGAIFSHNELPAVSNIDLHSGADIDLSENTSTPVILTATVTDADGYSDIVSATGKLYRSGAAGGASCTPSDTNCYVESSVEFTDCVGNSCNVTLIFDVEFFADATDAGSYAGEYWRAYIQIADSQSATDDGFSAAGVTDVNSLIAIDSTVTLDYGDLYAGGNTGASNQVINITNTGNVAIDINLSGSNLCTNYPSCTGNIIPVSNQEYALSPFNYGTGTDLTTGAATVNTNLVKSAVAPSNSQINTYWGISIPLNIITGSFSGVINISAVGDT